MTTDQAGPARAKVRGDLDAARANMLLREVALRVDTLKPPAVKPAEGGMIRLGRMDRSSYVWFLPCHPDAPDTPDGSKPKTCNHGFGVDREGMGRWTIRAWAHGAPGVYAVEMHGTEITHDLIAQAATLVGIPLRPNPGFHYPWAEHIPLPHPPENCGPLKFSLPAGQTCSTCGLRVEPAPKEEVDA